MNDVRRSLVGAKHVRCRCMLLGPDLRTHGAVDTCPDAVHSFVVAIDADHFRIADTRCVRGAPKHSKTSAAFISLPFA
jgi:hypothetical protein